MKKACFFSQSRHLLNTLLVSFAWTIAVIKAASEHIGDGFDAAICMPRKAVYLLAWIVIVNSRHGSSSQELR